MRSSWARWPARSSRRSGIPSGRRQWPSGCVAAAPDDHGCRSPRPMVRARPVGRPEGRRRWAGPGRCGGPDGPAVVLQRLAAIEHGPMSRAATVAAGVFALAVGAMAAALAMWATGVRESLTPDLVLFPVAYLAFAGVGAL